MSIEAQAAQTVPLERARMQKPVENPVSELAYLSARKEVVAARLRVVGREMCELQNELARLNSREDEAICMLHAREPKPSQAPKVTQASRSSRPVSPKTRPSKRKTPETPGLRVTSATRST